MLLNKARMTAAIGFVLLFSADIRAEDWLHQSFKVAGGGTVEFSFPASWGKKPVYQDIDSVADIKFGPYGPKSKPIFLAHIQAVVAVDPISNPQLLAETKRNVEILKESAFETDIPISDFEGPNIVGHYFSITDKESKRGEFDYMTMAVISSGRLLVKCYFLSSDGAPDFGADAMQMMRSIKYIAPPPEPEKK